MKNDNNFFLVIVITICVLVFYPALMKKIAPQFFPEPKQTETQPQTYNAPSTTHADVQVKKLPSIGVSYSKSETYGLYNNLMSVEVNAPAGDIKSIQLLQIKDPVTESSTSLMDTQNLMPGIFSDTGLTDKAALYDTEHNDSTAIFHYKHAAGLKIRKQIRIDEQSYKLLLSYIIENPLKTQQNLEYRIVTATGLQKGERVNARFNNQITILKSNKTIKKNLNNKAHKTIEGEIGLAGATMRYFSLIGVPLVSADYVYSYNPGEDDNFAPTAVGIGKRNLIIPAKETVRLDYVLYAGPNDHEQMSKLNLGVEKVRGSGLFAGLSDLMLLLLRVLHKLFKNYGLAVIGLALTINLLLYPLTFKSLKSMKDMQALQPLIEKIRIEHKDNPQKLNKETMELYKKHKVNPAGGCLPMMLQMPIFFSLYGVLMRAIELRGARFLWISNLAAPDAFISFQSKLPFIGNSLNLLPLIMMAFSFLQQKATNTGHVNEQQKMMALMMPLLMGVIFYNFPAGLVLYFLTNSIFSFFIQKSLAKKTEAAT